MAENIKNYGGDPGKISLMGQTPQAPTSSPLSPRTNAISRRCMASPAVLKGVVLLDTAGYDIALETMGELSEGRLNRSLYENAFGTASGGPPAAEASPIPSTKPRKDLRGSSSFTTDRQILGPSLPGFCRRDPQGPAFPPPPCWPREKPTRRSTSISANRTTARAN